MKVSVTRGTAWQVLMDVNFVNKYGTERSRDKLEELQSKLKN